MTPEAVLLDASEVVDMEPPKELIKGSGVYLIESEIPHRKNGHVVVVDEHTIIDSGGIGEIGRIDSSLDALGFSLQSIKRVLVTDIHADHLVVQRKFREEQARRYMFPKVIMNCY